MKPTPVLGFVSVLALFAFASCKKNYTCTCTTVVGASSVNVTHAIDNAYMSDAKTSCNNYQDQANNTLPGGTTCHL